MFCNTRENAFKDLVRQGIIDENRLLQSGKEDAFHAANQEFSDIAKEQYKIEGEPFFGLSITHQERSERPRRPTSIIKRVVANLEMFKLLDAAVNKVLIPAVNKEQLTRTMTSEKKSLAEGGTIAAQREWIREEIGEFYDALRSANTDEIADETIGLFRTAQNFPEVSDELAPYLEDIKKAFSSFDYDEHFTKWKAKKELKGQAKDVTSESLKAFINTFNPVLEQGLPELGTQLTFFQLYTPTILDTIIEKAADPSLLSKYLTPNSYMSILANAGFTVGEVEYLTTPLRKDPNLWMSAPNVHNLISWKSQEQLAFDETETGKKANEALDARMLAFLKPLGITVTEVDSLKKRFGVNSLGIAAIVDKAIYLAKDRLLTTLPEEVAHFYVEMLNKRNTKDDMNSYRLYKDIFEKIEDWSGYKAVYNQYYKKYDGNIEMIKKEAIAKIIAEAIAQRWSAETNPLKALILQAIAWLKERLLEQKNFDIRLLADEIATSILNLDYKDISKDLSSTAILTQYSNLPKPLVELLDKFSALGAYSTGSISLRDQGTIYRDKAEEFHDLDFKVSIGIMDSFIKDVLEEFPEIHKRHEFEDKNGNVATLWELEYKGHKYAIDFFFDKQPFSTSRGMVSWRDTFEAKQRMGREKDVTDFINYRPRVVPVPEEGLTAAQKKQRQLVIKRIGEIQELLGVKSEIVDALVQNQQRLNSLQIALRSSYNTEEKRVLQAEINQLEKEVSTTDVAVADIMNRLIQFASGHLSEDNFTEETLHYVVDIVQQKFPELYTAMDQKIVRFKLYGEVLSLYRDDPAYKNEDGSVNFGAIRKEAITQMLSSELLGHEEPLDESEENKTFISYIWNKIADLIKRLFGQLPEDIRYTFREAANEILTNPNFIVPEDVVYLGTDVFKAKGVNDLLRKYRVSQREVARALLTDSAKKGSVMEKVIGAIRAIISGGATGAAVGAVSTAAAGAIGIVPGAFVGAGISLTRYFIAEKEAIVKHLQSGSKIKFESNLQAFNYLMGLRAICALPDPEADHYEILGGIKLGRITSVLSAISNFRYKNVNKDAAKELLRKLKAEKGSLIHKEIQAIIFRLVDPETGLRRADPLPKATVINTRRDIYDHLYSHLTERLDSYPAGTRFVVEQPVFNLAAGYAGTVDFIAIKPDMNVDILDWKSTEIFYYNHATGKVEPRTDVAPFNLESWPKQIDMYKNALISHGFKDFGFTRAVPISTEWTKQQIIPNRDWSAGNIEFILKGIDIGPVDMKRLPRSKDYLGVVPTLTEGTGNAEVDKMILTLDALMRRVQATPFKGADRNKKILEIESIRKAIREIQLHRTAYNLTHIFTTSFSRYTALVDTEPDFIKDLIRGVAFQDQKVTDDIEKYAGELREASEFLSVFAGITDTIRTLYGDELTKGQETTLDKLADIEREASRLKSLAKARINTLMDATANTVGVQSLDSTDFEGRFTDTFMGASRQEEKTLAAAYRLTQAAKQTEITIEKELHTKIKAAFEGIKAWAKKNGKSLKEAEALIVNLAEGYLHGEIAKGYYEELKTKKEEFAKYKEKVTESFKDTGYSGSQLVRMVNESMEDYMEPWLKENIDFEKFKEEYEKQRESYKNYLSTLSFSPDEKIDIQQKNVYLRDWESKKNVLHYPEALDKKNFFIKANLTKWISPEYSELNKTSNKELLDAHSLFVAINIRAIKLGMMEDMYNAKHFFAQIEKDGTIYSAKKAVKPISKSLKNFMKWGFESVKTLQFAKWVSETSAEIPESVGTEIDLISGSRRLYLPVRYARLPKGENVEGETSVSLVFAKWATEVARYEGLLNYENRMRLLVLIEAEKTRVVPTKLNGDPMTLADREQGGSAAVFQEERKADASVISTDTKLETFINHYYYGTDPVVDPTWKKVTGFLNKYARVLLLSLKPELGIANYFGGAVGSTIKAGLYASKGDIRTADAIITPGVPTKYSKELALAVLAHISPDRGLRSIEESYSEFEPGLHVNPMDILMIQFKLTDEAIKHRIGLAALLNTAVIDGELVNIPIYVRRNFTDKIDERINDLRKSNILKTATQDASGALTIPGIDLSTNKAKTSVMRMRLLIEGMTDDAIGNMTGNDASYMDLNYYVSSTILPFKKWMPAQISTRAGQDTYDWKRDQAHLGRWKTAYKGMAAYGKTKALFLGLALLPLGSIRRRTGILNPSDTLRSRPELQEAAKLAYVDMLEYYRVRKSEMPLSETEFVETYLSSIDGAISEIGTIITLAIFMNMVTYALHNAGDDKKWYIPSLNKMWFQLWQEITNLGSPSAMTYTLQHALPTLGVIQIAWEALASLTETIVGEAEQLIPSQYWKYEGVKKVQAAHPIYKTLQAVPIVRQVNQKVVEVSPRVRKAEGAPPPSFKQR